MQQAGEVFRHECSSQPRDRWTHLWFGFVNVQAQLVMCCKCGEVSECFLFIFCFRKPSNTRLELEGVISGLHALYQRQCVVSCTPAAGDCCLASSSGGVHYVHVAVAKIGYRYVRIWAPTDQPRSDLLCFIFVAEGAHV